MRDEPEPVEDDAEPDPRGSLRPTSPGVLVGWALVGLVGGWALPTVCAWWDLVPPLVSWAQPLTLLLLAAILAYVAWATWRAVHVRQVRLEAHQAVNRLVLSRACALVAALVGGGYLGYGLSWIGDPAELADERMIRSLVAAAACAIGVVAAVLLERACRVRKDESQP